MHTFRCTTTTYRWPKGGAKGLPREQSETTVELTVDDAALCRMLAQRALGTKGLKSSLAGGLVEARVVGMTAWEPSPDVAP